VPQGAFGGCDGEKASHDRDIGIHIAGVLPAARDRLSGFFLFRRPVMNSRIGLLALAAVVLFCLAGSAQATTLFLDNFESYTDAATSWNDGGDHDPGGSWSNDETVASNIQVMANPANGAFTTPYGSQYLHLYRDRWGTTAASAMLDSSAQASVTTNQNAHLEADLYNSGGAGAGNLGVSLMNAENMLCQLVLMPAGVFGYEATKTTLALSFPMDTWNHVAIDVNLATQKWSATVNGVTASDLSFYNSGQTTITQALFSVWDRSGTGELPYCGVDGVLISTVPEPSYVILLSSSLLGLLACAWRRRR
jgi:hypothetical protein